MFQSLIGWLQTFIIIHFINRIMKVSIPYRLATNADELKIVVVLLSVSIPYRLATNLDKLSLFTSFILRFNPL